MAGLGIGVVRSRYTGLENVYMIGISFAIPLYLVCSSWICRIPYFLPVLPSTSQLL